MASSKVLSQTLLSITNIKLQQLQKQKDAYESSKRQLLNDAGTQVGNRTRTGALIEGAGKLPSMTSLDANPTISVKNLKRFVEQAEHDPSVSDTLLRDYEDAIRNELQVQSNKYEFASLYGKLVNEWIAAGKSEDAASESGSHPVGREEMHQQRAIWEEYVFKAKETDTEAIRSYLGRVFNGTSKDVKTHFDSFVKSMEDFQDRWDNMVHFNEDTLTGCIRRMLRGDAMAEEKRTTLRDFLGNKIVLSEIADVLNTRMAARKTWTWDSVLVVEQRRNLNGRYRFYPDEDLLQSIFIHYIGMQWCVQLRKDLIRFATTPAVWKPDTKPISKTDLRRREYFLEGGVTRPHRGCSVQQKVEDHFRADIFLDQLPASMVEQRGTYPDDEDEEDDTRKSHINVAQNLLHLIESQIILQTKLGRDVTVIRSDFKWFGPSIPHSSIFTILEFFGVNADWVDFFKRVIQSPFKFKQDPADVAPQTRRRGTPLATPIADFMGESLLFCLDFAVNQLADGARLYRLHDDMWLWGEADTCVKGWKTLTQFAAMVGLELNEEKTGAVTIPREGSENTAKLAVGLPRGSVRWGFLKLDPVTGRFLIDQAEVDKHIEELRRQLEGCKTIFDWAQAWNIYGKGFFSTHFGRPAHCFSRAHVDSILETFSRIQRSLFPDSPGGVGEHLKKMVAQRCGLNAADIPDGYLYFPAELGGLGLQNPFIHMYLVRDGVTEDPASFVAEALEQEASEWRAAKARFEELEAGGGDSRARAKLHSAEWTDLRNEPFMSLEEFSRYRERTSRPLGNALHGLLLEPTFSDVELRGGVRAALEKESDWAALSSYEKWVVQLFHRDMIARFGGLNIVDKELLPMGLIGMLRQRRFRWQG